MDRGRRQPQGGRRPSRAYLGDFTLDRYGHLYPESDAALRDRLDTIYTAGERDKSAAVMGLFRGRSRPQNVASTARSTLATL